MFDNISKAIEKIKDIGDWNPVKKVSEKVNNLLDIGKDTKAVQDVKKTNWWNGSGFGDDAFKPKTPEYTTEEKDDFLIGFKEGPDGFSLKNTVDSVKNGVSDAFESVKTFGRETLNKGSAWMNDKGVFDDATNAFFKAYNINQKFPIKKLPTGIAHHVIADSNYKENQKIDLSGYEQTGGYINDQNTGEVGKLKYGGGTLDDNGCGIIAVNNALVSLEDKKDIRDIAKEFETGGQVLFGAFGTNPYDIGDYFKKKGYNVETFTGDDTIYNLDIPDADTYILSFWNSDKIMGGIHTVAMKKLSNGKYRLYNQYPSIKDVESLNDFFTENNRVPLTLHCIKKG